MMERVENVRGKEGMRKKGLEEEVNTLIAEACS